MEELSTTWDGKSIAPEWPTGASVVVYRTSDNGIEFLLLHRAHGGADFEGDWAWTPPSGARFPGEDIESCARRELLEEIGAELTITPTVGGPEDWVLFAAEATSDLEIVLTDPEHDKFEWVPLGVALQKCKPERVAKGMEWIAQQLGVQHGAAADH